MSDIKTLIESGKTVLGIEFGSTRIKAVLIGEDNVPVASEVMTGKPSYQIIYGVIH